MQRELVPDTDKTGAFYHIVGRLIPCRTIGGDFIETMEVGPSQIAIAIGDVAGKGPSAALLSSFLVGFIHQQRAWQP